MSCDRRLSVRPTFALRILLYFCNVLNLNGIIMAQQRSAAAAGDFYYEDEMKIETNLPLGRH